MSANLGEADAEDCDIDDEDLQEFQPNAGIHQPDSFQSQQSKTLKDTLQKSKIEQICDILQENWRHIQQYKYCETRRRVVPNDGCLSLKKFIDSKFKPVLRVLIDEKVPETANRSTFTDWSMQNSQQHNQSTSTADLTKTSDFECQVHSKAVGEADNGVVDGVLLLDKYEREEQQMQSKIASLSSKLEKHKKEVRDLTKLCAEQEKVFCETEKYLENISF